MPAAEFTRSPETSTRRAKTGERCCSRALAPDGSYGWFIAALCFLVSLLYSSVYRCSGLFFTAMMSTYSTTRADASKPLAVYDAFSHLASLPAGPLIQSCGVRFTTFIGGLLISLGFMVSVFATGIPFLVVTFGVLAGSGHGVLFPCLIALISQYFVKRRGTALGIHAAGAAMASLIFAKLYELCLAEYGVRMTLGLAGALMLNIPVISVLFRNPQWTECATQRRRPWTSISSWIPSNDKGVSVILKGYTKSREQRAECLHVPLPFSVPQRLFSVENEDHSTVTDLFQFQRVRKKELVLGVLNVSKADAKEEYVFSEKKRINLSHSPKLGLRADEINKIKNVSSTEDNILKLKGTLCSSHHDVSDRSLSFPIDSSTRDVQESKNSGNEVPQSVHSASGMSHSIMLSNSESIETCAAAVPYTASILRSFREVLTMPRFYALVVVYFLLHLHGYSPLSRCRRCHGHGR